MMETIRIYHSTWRMLLLAIVRLAMAVGGYLMANALDRSIRKLNRQLVNAQENISTTGTGMKAQELCDLLNERLRRR